MGTHALKCFLDMSDPENNLKAPRKLLNASRGFFIVFMVRELIQMLRNDFRAF